MCGGYMDRREFLENMLKGVGGLAVANLVSSCLPAYKYRETPDLTVTNKFIDHPLTYKNRIDGERRLQKLAATAYLEESWMFFELKEPQPDFWIDVGVLQGPGFNLIVSRELLSAAKIVYDSEGYKVPTTFYHIHPQYLLEDYVGPVKQFFGLDSLGYTKDTKEIFLAVPSHADILSSIINSDEFNKKGYDLESSRIASPFGITKYNPNKKLKERYYNLGHKNGLKSLEFLVMNSVYEGIKKKSVDHSISLLKEAGLDITYTRNYAKEKAKPRKK